MADTTFVDKRTVITADWANDVNDLVYRYTQEGTGAVTRSVQDKINERVSVKDFGATGDGTTDDTAAIQLAINYVESLWQNIALSTPGSMCVFFPAGTYIVTDTLTCRGTMTLMGDGYPSTASGSYLVMPNNGASAKDLIKLMNTSLSPDENICSVSIVNLRMRQASATSIGKSLIYCPSGQSSASIYIENCWLTNSETYAILIEEGDDIQIRNCTIEVNQSGSAAVQLGTPTKIVSNAKIMGCTFYNNTPGPSIAPINTPNIMIANNHCYGSAGNNVEFFIDANTYGTVDTNGMSITGNVLNYCDTMVTLKDSNCTIADNMITNGTETIIAIGGGGSVGGLAITGNTFSCNSGGNPIIDAAATSVVYSTIIGNNFVGNVGGGSTTTCINLPNTSNDHNKITNNTFAGFTNKYVVNSYVKNGILDKWSTPAITPGVVTANTTFVAYITVTATSTAATAYSVYGLTTTAAISAGCTAVGIDGLAQYDSVTFTPADLTYPVPAGIHNICYVANGTPGDEAIKIEYRNVTGSDITISNAHQWLILGQKDNTY